jgi:hypothetical protein
LTQTNPKKGLIEKKTHHIYFVHLVDKVVFTHHKYIFFFYVLSFGHVFYKPMAKLPVAGLGVRVRRVQGARDGHVDGERVGRLAAVGGGCVVAGVAGAEVVVGVDADGLGVGAVFHAAGAGVRVGVLAMGHCLELVTVLQVWPPPYSTEDHVGQGFP